MSFEKEIKLVEELCMTPGISGFEEKIAEIIKRELKDVVDDIETDAMGNVIATKKGSSKKGPKVMLASHMDEIGLMVRYIDDNGYIKFSTIGGINDQMLMNQTVVVHSKNGDVTGVIGSKPPHITKPEERKKVVPFDEMFIDIGAKDKEQAEEMVSIGNPITFKSWFEAFPNNLIMSKALDNRLGCYVMMEVLKRVDSKATVYGVGTTQEEVGLKGAKVSSYKLNPDMAFALDVTLSGDHPGIKPDEAPVVIGKGPAVILIDASGRGIITPKSIRDLLIGTGENEEIPFQLEVSDGGTTDGTAIHLTKEGIPTGVLSVPTRYIHTTVSIASMEDVENTIQLIVAAINSLE
ncbi:M42 family metallopeptidase [Methanobrevibacter olleyae]|uniref:Endoglucanase n=1 Tax=Methanobrevibacter olleyae TaxID=294671 RepID=A0A126QZ29_METOL|nr:M42 family metallopeptidase [Methanobrevibacter olleyae]AMK15301.1 glutamyl aminopeptidase PepA [Methanobrevibacter olleyae]SFL29620.1 endoglucanase [Methanobrevibacter olleyae]